jgi:hypothetical protein
MADSIMDYIAGYYRATHEQVLKVVDSLDDQQIMWRPNRTTPSSNPAGGPIGIKLPLHIGGA